MKKLCHFLLSHSGLSTLSFWDEFWRGWSSSLKLHICVTVTFKSRVIINVREANGCCISFCLFILSNHNDILILGLLASRFNFQDTVCLKLQRLPDWLQAVISRWRSSLVSFLASFLTNYQLKTWRHHCTGHYLGHWWQLALTNSTSHYWDGCETVFVMFITLPPLSGQALLQGSESPTSATYSNSSEIEGWNMPSFLSRKDMKNVLLWLPIGTPFNCSADRKNLTWNHWQSNLVFLSSLPGKKWLASTVISESQLLHTLWNFPRYWREEGEDQR